MVQGESGAGRASCHAGVDSHTSRRVTCTRPSTVLSNIVIIHKEKEFCSHSYQLFKIIQDSKQTLTYEVLFCHSSNCCKNTEKNSTQSQFDIINAI